MGAAAQSIDRAAAAISAGDSLRLDVSRIGRVEGRFILANAATLTLASDDSSMQVSLTDIERLWVRGHQTGKGALIGAGVGVLVGIVGGLLISRVACEPIDGGDCTAVKVAAATGFLGGAGGAALGAGLGFLIPAWHLRFP